MFDAGGSVSTKFLFAALDAVLDRLTGLELDRHTDEEVLELLSGLEARTRRLAVVDHALIAQVEHRGLANERAVPSTAAFLARLLRVSAGEARARVRAAQQLAPRQVAGQQLPAEYPATAAAQAAGDISVAQARIVTQTIHALPPAIRDEQFDTLETQLVAWAHDFGPDQLTRLGRHLHDVLDPDGILHDARHRERTRDLTVHQRPDGSVTGSFAGTARFGEALLTLLDATAAPAPETPDGQRDQRTPGQRRHDGLLDGLLAVLRSGELGTHHGVSTTILISLTDEQLRSGDGVARTGHGARIPVRDAIHDLGDARLVPVALGTPTARGDAGSGAGSEAGSQAEPDPPSPHLRVKAIAGYGTSHRIFTELQRLAMGVRDGGCSFPGCTVGIAWTQAHHVTDWRYTGRTSIDDGALACGYHHREFERLGWQCRMIDGIPHWLAPPWLDPTQTWQRNTAHDVAALV